MSLPLGRLVSLVRPGDRADGGFVLALVVFMLFAISIAGATGYMLVTSEFEMAKHSGQGAEALTVARAGLERFIAEQIGTVPDTTQFAMGDGVATVTARKLFEQDSLTQVYYVRSEGTVDDIFEPGTPAKSVVGAYATRHRRPIPHHASVMISSDYVDVQSGGEAHGQDYQTSTDCPDGGASTITGAIGRLGVSEDVSTAVQGSPESETWAGGWSEMLDSIKVRWDVLSDPNFPVEFENSLPSFGSLPPDSFPVIRYTGWVSAGFIGRGVLIIDGMFDPTSSFDWNGIVLAKDADDYIQGTLNGLLVAGLEAPNFYSTVYVHTQVNYHSCYVYGANESLSYFELMPNTIHEAG